MDNIEAYRANGKEANHCPAPLGALPLKRSANDREGENDKRPFQEDRPEVGLCPKAAISKGDTHQGVIGQNQGHCRE